LRAKKVNVETEIQLRHPSGKKAFSMEKGKYEVMKKTLLNCLSAKGPSTHTEILQAISKDFKQSNFVFDGSLEWHMEWVKLDLEAGKEIKRMDQKSPVKFSLV